MPTLAQVLKDEPGRPPLPHLETVISSTPTTIQTASGPLVNAIGAAVGVGKRVVVLRVEGLNIALGVLPS